MSHTKEVDQNIRNGKSSGITYSILAEAEYVCHCAVLSSVCLWQDPLYDYWLFVQLNKSYTRSWVNDRFKYYPPLTLLENWFAAKMVLLLLSLGFLLSVFPSLKLTTDVFICAYFVCSYQKFHARCRDTVNADNRLCLSRHEEIWWSASTGQPVLSCLPDLIVNLLVILYIFGLSLLLIFSSLILIVAQYLSSGTIPSQFTDR